MGEALDCCDVKRNADKAVHEFYRAAPGGVPTQVAFSQRRRYPTLDLDRANGCIRDKANAYSQDGGLAVLFGNIAEKGCIVKTAGVDDSNLRFTGRARVCQSQEEAVEKILADQIVAGDIVVVRLRRPQGRPRHAGNALPDQLPEVQGPGQGSAPCSPTGASPAAPRASRSATPRPKPPPAAPSAWSRKATGSRSTFPTAASN
jgi:dihydroxy-acid dehydratase